MEEYRSGHNESDSKSFDGVSRPWVRIPPPPPLHSDKLSAFAGRMRGHLIYLA